MKTLQVVICAGALTGCAASPILQFENFTMPGILRVVMFSPPSAPKPTL
jgi:hypothetical protein